MKTTGSIRWPADPREAKTHLLGFFILVLEELGLAFDEGPTPDPLVLAKAFIAGDVSDAEYAAKSEEWWRFLDTVGGIRDFRSRPALKARLALLLLSEPRDDTDARGEALDWFTA